MSAGNITGAFTVGENAWWDPTGEHTHDREPATIAEARQWAEQAWEYESATAWEDHEVWDPTTFEYQAGDRVVQLAAPDPSGDDPEVPEQIVYRAVPHEKRIRRSDNHRHLLTTTDSYEIVGVQEMWEVVEAVATQNKRIHFRSGGTLDHGVELWALAELDEPWHAPGDPSLTYPYVVFLNSINKKGACKVVNTTIRVVCKNTFGMADAEGRQTGREFTFRHTKGVHDRIEQAQRALQGLADDTAAWRELATELAQLPINDRQRELFVVNFFPRPPDAIVSERALNNCRRDRDALRTILASETCEGIADNGYGLVQAGAEWLTHVRRTNNSSSFIRRALLTPDKMKARAITLARDVADTKVTAKELAEVGRL
jgi:phage/plasmid-like protein (TIGR03299 family)